jgi:hypothetical protein
VYARDNAIRRPAVPRRFTWAENATVVCVAPGPSLTYGDLRLLSHAAPPVVVITINDAYRPYPQADYRFAADGYWWAQRTDAYAQDRYGGGCYTLEHGAPPSVHRLDYASGEILSDDPHILATGGHSGYSAVNFAYLLGARRIGLLGYDMQAHPTTGQHHFGGDEPGQRHLRYHLWLPRYAPLRTALAGKNVDLLNCTRASAIPESDVPRCSLEDFLCGV